MISLYPPYISSFFWFPSLRIHIFWSSSRIHFQHLVQPLGVSSTKVSISALPLTFTSSWNPKPTMPSMGIVRKAEPYSWRPAERPAAASRNVENPLPISQVPCKKWLFFLLVSRYSMIFPLIPRIGQLTTKRADHSYPTSWREYEETCTQLHASSKES